MQSAVILDSEKLWRKREYGFTIAGMAKRIAKKSQRMSAAVELLRRWAAAKKSLLITVKVNSLVSIQAAGEVEEVTLGEQLNYFTFKLAASGMWIDIYPQLWTKADIQESEGWSRSLWVTGRDRGDGFTIMESLSEDVAVLRALPVNAPMQ